MGRVLEEGRGSLEGGARSSPRRGASPAPALVWAPLADGTWCLASIVGEVGAQQSKAAGEEVELRAVACDYRDRKTSTSKVRGKGERGAKASDEGGQADRGDGEREGASAEARLASPPVAGGGSDAKDAADEAAATDSRPVEGSGAVAVGGPFGRSVGSRSPRSSLRVSVSRSSTPKGSFPTSLPSFPSSSSLSATSPPPGALAEPPRPGTRFRAPASSLLPACPLSSTLEGDDVARLTHLNDACVLDAVRKRAGDVYTRAGLVLLALNPFRPVEAMYGERRMLQYASEPDNDARSPSSLPPHIYGVVEATLRDLRASGRSQAILISGESGAGKTETAKHAMRYLAYVTERESKRAHGGGGGEGADEGGDGRASLAAPPSSPSFSGPTPADRALAATPVLEAFGNARTERNRNSSRFGRLVSLELHPSTLRVRRAILETCLLEKSRVVARSGGERSYHVFYRLLAGATDAQRRDWGLGVAGEENGRAEGLGASDAADISPNARLQADCDRFAYLRGWLPEATLAGTDADAASSPDAACEAAQEAEAFAELRRSLSEAGVSPAEQDAAFRILVGILFLGNVSFVDVEDEEEDDEGEGGGSEDDDEGEGGGSEDDVESAAEGSVGGDSGSREPARVAASGAPAAAAVPSARSSPAPTARSAVGAGEEDGEESEAAVSPSSLPSSPRLHSAASAPVFRSKTAGKAGDGEVKGGQKADGNGNGIGTSAAPAAASSTHASGSRVSSSASSRSSLLQAARLLGTSPAALGATLTTKEIVVQGEQPITVGLRPEDAVRTRDGVAKALYAALFDWIVERINRAGEEAAKELQRSEERAERDGASHGADPRASASPDLPPSAATNSLTLSLLDIYGFESFASNSLEQLCINYANEALQQSFARHLFAAEVAEYEREGIDWSGTTFEDNRDCLKLLEGAMGVFALLDEECRFPGGTDASFVDKLVRVADGHPRLVPVPGGAGAGPLGPRAPRAPLGTPSAATPTSRASSAASSPREPLAALGRGAAFGQGPFGSAASLPRRVHSVGAGLGVGLGAGHACGAGAPSTSVHSSGLLSPSASSPVAPGFAVKHYAGPVHYGSEGLLEKNRDPVSPEATALLAVSADPLVRRLADDIRKDAMGGATAAGGLAAPGRARGRPPPRRGPSTLGGRFRGQLARLRLRLDASDARYVRCIKPNALQASGVFDAPLVLHQLRCCGVMEVARVARDGYPSRVSKAEALKRYEIIDVKHAVQRAAETAPPETDPDERLRAILAWLGLPFESFQVGRTKLFLRAGALARIEQAAAGVHAAAARIQAAVRGRSQRRWYLALRRAAVVVQSHWRRETARRRVEALRLSRRRDEAARRIARALRARALRAEVNRRVEERERRERERKERERREREERERRERERQERLAQIAAEEARAAEERAALERAREERERVARERAELEAQRAAERAERERSEAQAKARAEARAREAEERAEAARELEALRAERQALQAERERLESLKRDLERSSVGGAAVAAGAASAVVAGAAAAASAASATAVASPASLPAGAPTAPRGAFPTSSSAARLCPRVLAPASEGGPLSPSTPSATCPDVPEASVDPAETSGLSATDPESSLDATEVLGPLRAGRGVSGVSAQIGAQIAVVPAASGYSPRAAPGAVATSPEHPARAASVAHSASSSTPPPPAPLAGRGAPVDLAALPGRLEQLERALSASQAHVDEVEELCWVLVRRCRQLSQGRGRSLSPGPIPEEGGEEEQEEEEEALCEGRHRFHGSHRSPRPKVLPSAPPASHGDLPSAPPASHGDLPSPREVEGAQVGDEEGETSPLPECASPAPLSHPPYSRASPARPGTEAQGSHSPDSSASGSPAEATSAPSASRGAGDEGHLSPSLLDRRASAACASSAAGRVAAPERRHRRSPARARRSPASVRRRAALMAQAARDATPAWAVALQEELEAGLDGRTHAGEVEEGEDSAPHAWAAPPALSIPALEAHPLHADPTPSPALGAKGFGHAHSRSRSHSHSRRAHGDAVPHASSSLLRSPRVPATPSSPRQAAAIATGRPLQAYLRAFIATSAAASPVKGAAGESRLGPVEGFHDQVHDKLLEIAHGGARAARQGPSTPPPPPRSQADGLSPPLSSHPLSRAPSRSDRSASSSPPKSRRALFTNGTPFDVGGPTRGGAPPAPFDGTPRGGAPPAPFDRASLAPKNGAFSVPALSPALMSEEHSRLYRSLLDDAAFIREAAAGESAAPGMDAAAELEALKRRHAVWLGVFAAQLDAAERAVRGGREPGPQTANGGAQLDAVPSPARDPKLGTPRGLGSVDSETYAAQQARADDQGGSFLGRMFGF